MVDGVRRQAKWPSQTPDKEKCTLFKGRGWGVGNPKGRAAQHGAKGTLGQ